MMASTLPILSWGILGTGHIATRFASQVTGLGSRAKLQAVGARDSAKAAAFAAHHGIPTSGGYADVLADPAVDAVYIALLNRDHAAWSIAASTAGKRVLCEKPAALTEAELQTMLAAARSAGRLWMEAFAYRFHPRWLALRRAVSALGGPLNAHAHFSFGTGTVKDRLLDPVGGGALMDVGCYPLSWLIGLMGGPEKIRCTARRSEGGVDLASAISLQFAGGHIASALCGCDVPMPQVAHVAGPLGAIEITEPFRHAAGAVLRLQTAGTSSDIPWDDDGLELYAREAIAMAEFADGLEHPGMTWEDSVLVARTVDACRREAGVLWTGEISR